MIELSRTWIALALIAAVLWGVACFLLGVAVSEVGRRVLARQKALDEPIHPRLKPLLRPRDLGVIMSASIRDLKKMLKASVKKRGGYNSVRLEFELLRKQVIEAAKVLRAREQERALRQARLDETHRAWQARHEKYMDETPLEKLYDDELR